MATLSLPTRGRGPVESPELLVRRSAPYVDLADEEEAAPPTPLSEGLWRVPTVLLDPDAAWRPLRPVPDAEAGRERGRHRGGLADLAVDLATA